MPADDQAGQPEPTARRKAMLNRTLLISFAALLLGYSLSNLGRSWWRGKGAVARDFETMNTYGRITIPEDSGATDSTEEIAALAEGMAQRVNALMSPFGDGSDIKRLNDAPAGQWVEVDPLTWRVVMEALRWHRLSGGAFDPTIGPVKRLFRFDGSEAKSWPSEEALAEAKSKVGADKLLFEREGMRLAWKVDGMRLDLGAIAKGFAADLAAEELARHGVRNALVDIGGELRVLGSKPPKMLPWRAGIRHPRGEGMFETLPLENVGVATSGDYERYLMYQGKRYEHIIDPRLGLPLEGGLASVTVIHPTSCLAADALATTLCVLGVKDGEEFLREQALGLFSSGVRVIMLGVAGDSISRTEIVVDAEGGVEVIEN